MTTSDDKTPAEAPAEGGSTADGLRRAMAMKRKGAAGAGGGGAGGGGERPSAGKLGASKTIVANKPAFRRASKRG